MREGGRERKRWVRKETRREEVECFGDFFFSFFRLFFLRHLLRFLRSSEGFFRALSIHRLRCRRAAFSRGRSREKRTVAEEKRVQLFLALSRRSSLRDIEPKKNSLVHGLCLAHLSFAASFSRARTLHHSTLPTFDKALDEARVPHDHVVLVLPRRLADGDDEVASHFLGRHCSKFFSFYQVKSRGAP